MVQNRSQRLQFDISSPNGILLFREASKVICTYGNRIMNFDVPKNQLYPMRLKGISICFTMLKAALSGNYVNFGVCKLYGDETLDNVLDVTTKLILTIPQTDLLVPILVFATKMCASILTHLLLLSGVSKIVTIIFLASGVFGTRSHGVLIDT